VRIRRILRFLIVAAGIVIVLLVATVALLQTNSAKRLAFERLQKFLAGRDIAIEAADVDYGFTPLRISTGRISVYRISTPELPRFFSADSLSASIRLNDLIYGRYHIQDLRVENPAIHVVTDEQHRNNVPGRSDKAATSNEPVDLRIVDLKSAGGSFTLNDRSKNLFMTFPAWDLSMNASGLNDAEEFQFRTRADSEIRFNEKTLPIGSLDVQGALNQAFTNLDLHRARLSSTLGDLEFKGAIAKLSDPQLELQVNGAVYLKPVQQFLSIDQELQGDLNIDATVTGHPKELQLAGRVGGSDITAERFKGIALDANFGVDLGTNRARLTSIRAMSPNLSARGDADISFTHTAGESKIDARFDVADLQRLLRLYKLSTPLASRVAGNVRMSWPGTDVGRLKGNSRVQLFARSPVASARDIPVAGVVNVAVRGDRVTASIDELHSGAFHLAGQVDLQSQTQIGGAVRLEVTDLGQALPQVAGWLESSIPPNLHLSGPVAIDANLDGTLKQPRIGTKIEASGLRLNFLENIRLDAAAEYTPEQIVIPSLSVKWQAESMTGNGRIGLTTADPTLDGQIAMANASIHGVLAAFGRPEIPVAGDVEVAATISGTVKNPVVDANLKGSDLQAWGESIGSLSAEASLENQIVQLESLKLSKSGGGELQATGRYEIASGSYAVDLNGQDLQMSGIVLRQGPSIRGTVDLNAQGRGTFENPGGVIQLKARDLRVDSKEFQSVDLDVNLADHVAHLIASAPYYGVRANASIGIVSPYAAEAELHVDDADISHFPSEKMKEVAGHVTATVTAKGDLSDIEHAVARAEVPKFQIDWRNHAIRNDKPIQLSYANRELTIYQADLRFEDSTVQLSGNIPLEGSVGQLTIDGRASLADITSLIPQENPIEAKGQLLLNGSLRGNLKRMDPDLTITLTDGSVESGAIIAPLREANLKAVARDGRVVVEQLTARWGDAKVSAQGETTLAILPDLPIEIPRPDSPVRLSVDVDQFKLSSMTRPPLNTDGTISINIEAQAQSHDINSVQLRVRFPDLKFNAGTFVLEQVGISSIDVRDGIASVGQFHLTGPQTNLRLSGTADLRKSGPIDVQLKGETDAAVLALFSRTAKGTGTARLNVDVRGTMEEPSVNGYVELQDGQAKIDSPRLAAENVQVRLDLNGDRIDVTRLEGTLNGGTMRGEGHINLSGAQRGEMNLAVSGEGIYMEFPAGLKTVSNAQVRIDGAYPALRISGKIDVEEGAYTEPLTVGRGLMKFFSEDAGTTYVVNDSEDVKDTRLDIALRTLSPIIVNNNIAQGEIDAELRLLGTIGEPGLTGKIEVDEGARLYLRERKYSVDRGLITFNNEHAIEPILDVAATTTVNGSTSYDITMKISGDVSRKLDTDLTSSPPLDEGDIVSVLATGRTRNEASSQGADVAKEQILSFIAGDLGSSFTSEAGRAIGLSQVRIDPTFIDTTKKSTSSTASSGNSNTADIGNETEPTARLTLGKDITPKLSLVYSMNLRDSSDQIWVAEYDVTRRISTSAIRQEDNSFRVQAQHDLLFGLPSTDGKATTSVRRRIGSIQFSGNTHLSTGKLSSAVGLKTGKSYDFFSVQRGRERLEKTLEEDDRLESRISVERKTVGSTVDLVFHIVEGPQVRFVFEGWDVSNDLKSEIRKSWSSGVIDIQRVEDAVDLIESALIKERYFGFRVDSAIEMSNEEAKSVVFNIQPGSQYDNLRVGFEGVRSVRESDLQALLKAVGYFNQGPREREQALPAIQAMYRERGYLDVKVEPPSGRLDELSRTLTTTFPITEGGLYHFGEVRFQGNAEFKSELLLMTTKIGPETVFQVSTVTRARQALQELYRKSGYNDTTVQFSQLKDAARKSIDITFDIQEGRQRVVQEIRVEGNQKTSNGLVRSQLAMEPGDILSDEKLSVARTNLYDSGAYAFVDIDILALESSPALKPNQIPVRLVARVREVQPWELKYGGYLDSERGPGVITDFSNRNMLGHARILGMQVRYDADLSEGRMYFSQPVLRRFPVRSLFSAFISHEEQTDNDSHRTTITDKKGLSPSFEYKYRRNNTISLGYRLERTHQFTAVPDPAFPDSLARTAPVTTSFTRDTRDDPFDATRGHFMSHAVDWGTATLGSDLHYLKYFGQFFDYSRFGKPTLVPWTKEVRNRWLLAYGARVGLLKGALFQDFRTEQFKTGGGTTVRGFEQDKLGPLDADRNPLGGDAELILNTELRFPLYKFFDGVAFVDAGNVYPKLQDFSPFDLRASYGFGIRVRTPYLLFRFDYGINMNSKPNEPKGQFFFSFGQAF